MKTMTRRRPSDEPVDRRFVLLQFTDGLVVDPRSCPLGVLVHKHWRRVEGLEVAGEPNAECACTDEVA